MIERVHKLSERQGRWCGIFTLPYFLAQNFGRNTAGLFLSLGYRNRFGKKFLKSMALNAARVLHTFIIPVKNKLIATIDMKAMLLTKRMIWNTLTSTICPTKKFLKIFSNFFVKELDFVFQM